jgi:hypothetical protein
MSYRRVNQIARYLAVALLAAIASGCASGDALVVVTVDATRPVDGIADLRATASAGGQTMSYDLGASEAPFAIPPSRTFAVQVPAAISGVLTITVEARGQAGDVLATGEATTELAGGRSDVIIELGGSSVDGGTDLASPIVTAQSVWIAGGGSASAASHELNLSFGGVDTVGTAPAASAQLTTGFFVTQTF